MARSRSILYLKENDPIGAFADAKTHLLASLSPKRQASLPHRSKPRKRWFRWFRSLLLGCLLISVFLLLVGNISLNTLSSVDNAQARVTATLHVHHGKKAHGLLKTKLGQLHDAPIWLQEQVYTPKRQRTVDLVHQSVDALLVVPDMRKELTSRHETPGTSLFPALDLPIAGTSRIRENT